MNIETKQAFIQRKAKDNEVDNSGQHILWSRHAITEAVNDSLPRVDVESALKQSEIEDYPAHHRRLPDCLVLGYLPNAQPVHAVVAIDIAEDRIFLVTVYLPSEEKWLDDWRTRK